MISEILVSGQLAPKLLVFSKAETSGYKRKTEGCWTPQLGRVVNDRIIGKNVIFKSLSPIVTYSLPTLLSCISTTPPQGHQVGTTPLVHEQLGDTLQINFKTENCVSPLEYPTFTILETADTDIKEKNYSLNITLFSNSNMVYHT